MSSIDQQFVEFVVKSLVNNPDDVQVERTIDEKGVLLELTVDPEDLGRVIGKRGATAQSIRTLLRALGTKNDARYNLKIVDNGVPREERQAAAPADEPVDDAASDDDEKPADEVAEEKDDSVSATADLDLDDEDEDEAEVAEEADEEESLADRTRKELEDLDDLDV